ncbi:cation transporting ATPase C-terminal domain-containing protein [Nonomuraea glycinis]|uniref:cation transporting ATPase C-terminal domain-containing protein n=1 Tax=Nonomuraea glycinis TaxID=2047744 RepID=UPI0033BF7574
MLPSALGTDLLPALALGAEPANPRAMHGPARTGNLIDRRLLARVFGVLGQFANAFALAGEGPDAPGVVREEPAVLTRHPILWSERTKVPRPRTVRH